MFGLLPTLGALSQLGAPGQAAIPQALAPVTQALGEQVVQPLQQAFAPVQQAMAQPQAMPVANTFDTLQGAFTHPQLGSLRDMLGAIPGIEDARSQFQTGMSPPAQKLLGRVYQGNNNGMPLGDFFNQVGFPGFFNGAMRWPQDLSSKLFYPPQTEMFKGLYGQMGALPMSSMMKG
jgi:hypothetical protein